MTQPIKVLIADDHPVFRRGLATVLQTQNNLQLIGEATNGLEAIAKAEELQPDVILMDIQMPGCTGLEATLALQQKQSPSKILILTISDKEEDLFTAVKSGARGYILKGIEVQELLAAVNSVAAGEAIISPSMAAKLLEEFKGVITQREQKEDGLSHREREILQLVGNGDTNKDIATQLFISESTVKAHLRNILEKLHLKNRSQVAAYAAQKGWLRNKTP